MLREISKRDYRFRTVIYTTSVFEKSIHKVCPRSHLLHKNPSPTKSIAPDKLQPPLQCIKRLLHSLFLLPLFSPYLHRRGRKANRESENRVKTSKEGVLVQMNSANGK